MLRELLDEVQLCSMGLRLHALAGASSALTLALGQETVLPQMLRDTVPLLSFFLQKDLFYF